MQTLRHPDGRLRDLRAISLGQRPGRWPSPSMRSASTWKSAPPLPNHPKPTSAVGSRPGLSRQRFRPMPLCGGPVCRWRLRSGRLPSVALSPLTEAGFAPGKPPVICPHIPPPKRLGIWGQSHWQARASTTLRAASFGLSFPLRPLPSGGRASGKKTADRTANVGALAGVSHAAHRRCGRALRQRSSSAGG